MEPSQTLRPRFEKGVWLCQDCGVKSQNSESVKEKVSSTQDLRKWLKLQLALRLKWGKIRVMTTSCMDICPKDKLLVSIADDHSRCFAVDPKDRQALLEKILSEPSDTKFSATEAL